MMRAFKNHKTIKITLLLTVVGFTSLLVRFLLSESYHFQMPTQFTAAKMPQIEIEVDGNKHFIGLDLGSKFQMCMPPDALKNIPKTPSGTMKWVNGVGQKHECPQYTIPTIQIGPLLFKNIMAVEKPRSIKYTLWSDPDKSKLENFPKPNGYLGKNLLQNMNLLLDLGHSSITISNNRKKLKQDGYDINHYKKFPLEITDKLILIQVDTDYGPMKLALDTGATSTIIDISLIGDKPYEGTIYGVPFTNFQTFNIHGHDFGKHKTYLLNIAKEIRDAGIDGVIGMNFIEEHVIYLDFPNNTAYIDTP